MPGVSRNQRTEAKYNVTLDFPHLGLHSAASSGNLGLVTYALDHGQPVNSVVDGVLPLHVASSGGNDLIVRLLIERGADVNAPRLPRKYSSDRHRDTSAPIVGTSGSTPLHFAAANGHEQVVLTLLLHGAHPDRPDKHGVTPESVARQNGWTSCAELLSKWTHEKDRDLREREAVSGSIAVHAPEADTVSTYSRQDIECKIRQQGLRMKTSIDNALSILKTPLPTAPPSAGMLPHEAVYAASPPPMAGSASLESSPATSAGHEFPQNWERRPSLPQIFDTPPHPAHSHSMSTSQAQGSSHHPVKSSGRPSFSSSRRPRSAGTDADSSVPSISSTPGRLRGKLSLLSMFKKAAGESVSSASSPGIATPESRDSFTGTANSSSAVASSSPSPVPERERGDGQRRARSRGASAHSPLRTRVSETGLLSSMSPPALSTVPSTRSRLSESESPYPPLAIELHRKLSMERLRSRSGSGSSSTQNQNPSTLAERAAQSPSPQHAAPPQSQPASYRSPPPRSGILRPHGRSASSGQSTFQRPDGLAVAGEGSTRSLRFDPSATGTPAVLHPKRSGLNLDLRGSGSISSLRGDNQHQAPSSPRSPWSTSSSRARLRERERDPSVDATNYRHRNYTIVDDEDEEGYGEVISPRIGLGLALESEGAAGLHEPHPEAEVEEVEERSPSMASQASRESPTVSVCALPSPTVPPESGFDCPFSINRPPPEPLPPLEATSTSSPPLSQSLLGVDNRARGDSFGSMSTSTDASSLPVTPGPGPALGLEILSPDAGSLDLPLDDDDFAGVGVGVDSAGSAERTNCLVEHERERERQRSSRARTMSPPRSRSRAHPPHHLDIDIRAISSHAQAEALVQRAQKDILDMQMQNGEIDLPGLGAGMGMGMGMVIGSTGSTGSVVGSTGTGTGTGSGTGTLPGGRTPLSAKLAAYGESLAIERRFKQREERARERATVRDRDLDGVGPMPVPRSPTRPGPETPVGSPRDRLRTRASEGGIRKFSLEERPTTSTRGGPQAGRRSKPRRPHTSDGDTSDNVGAFLSPPPHKSVSPGHKASLSSSAAMDSVTSRLSPNPTDRIALARPPATSRTLLPGSTSTPSSFDDRLPHVVRSRTPDHDRPYVGSPSPSPSPSALFGVPLSRVSTAPPRHASPDIIAQRTLSEQERERARANKLMKMGLLAHDAFPRAHSPYGHARNGGGSGGVGGGGVGGGVGGGGTTGGKHRFGGLRGFVQTLTGKS